MFVYIARGYCALRNAPPPLLPPLECARRKAIVTTSTKSSARLQFFDESRFKNKSEGVCLCARNVCPINSPGLLHNFLRVYFRYTSTYTAGPADQRAVQWILMPTWLSGAPVGPINRGYYRESAYLRVYLHIAPVSSFISVRLYPEQPSHYNFRVVQRSDSRPRMCPYRSDEMTDRLLNQIMIIIVLNKMHLEISLELYDIYCISNVC